MFTSLCVMCVMCNCFISQFNKQYMKSFRYRSIASVIVYIKCQSVCGDLKDSDHAMVVGVLWTALNPLAVLWVNEKNVQTGSSCQNSDSYNSDTILQPWWAEKYHRTLNMWNLKVDMLQGQKFISEANSQANTRI